MENEYENFKNSFNNKLEVKNTFLFYKKIDIDKRFKINLSTMYCPHYNLNGTLIANRGKSIFMFILNNGGSPILILACNNKNKEQVAYIDDFIDCENIEGRLLKHSVLFENVFFEKDFWEKTLTEETRDSYANLYSKHNDLLSNGTRNIHEALNLFEPLVFI